MSDVVERLRDRGVCSIAQNSCRNDWACTEAADEIERLREALKAIAQPRHGHQALVEDGKEQPKHLYPYYAGVTSQLQQIARAALKGNQ